MFPSSTKDKSTLLQAFLLVSWGQGLLKAGHSSKDHGEKDTEYLGLFHALCHPSPVLFSSRPTFSPSHPVPLEALPTALCLPHQIQLHVGFGFPFSTTMSPPLVCSLILTHKLSTSSLPVLPQRSMHSHCSDM